MEYLVTRLFDGGRVLPSHVRHASTVRGTLSVRQEDDRVRHRTVLVARLTPSQSIGARALPPLYDVTLIASTGAVWTLAGYERVTAGALQETFMLGQSWLVSPAPLEDLRTAENEWARLAELLARVQTTPPPEMQQPGQLPPGSE